LVVWPQANQHLVIVAPFELTIPLSVALVCERPVAPLVATDDGLGVVVSVSSAPQTAHASPSSHGLV
jgi:hypothetical protein